MIELFDTYLLCFMLKFEVTLNVFGKNSEIELLEIRDGKTSLVIQLILVKT